MHRKGMTDADAPTTSTFPLEGYATFERRRITLSDAGVELVRKKTFSPSTASVISSCGGRFVVERLLERLAPRQKDPLGAAELGTATHQVFEDLFARPKGERGLVVGAKLLERLEIDHPELEPPSDPVLLAQWRSEVQTRVVGLWEIENPDEIDVVARELHVAVDLDGIPFNGFIDRVHRKGGGICVTDFKGGAGKPKKESTRHGDQHGDQVRLYSRALEAKCPELGPVTSGEVLYVFHRKRRDIDMSKSAMDGTRARYEKAWRLLTTQTEAGAFGLRTSPLCGWCPAVQICPAALASGKVPKTESAEHGALLGIALADGLTLPMPGMPTSTKAADTSVVDPSAFSEETYDPAVDFADGSSTDDVPVGSPAIADRATADSAGVELAPPSVTSDAPAVGAPAEASTTTTTDNATATPQTSKEMRSMYDELKPWEETNADGTLNLNSYAATAAFGTVSLAVEVLHKAGQKLTPKTVDAFAETLALIIQHCQESLDVRPSMQDGSHTRLRGALRTSIETIPAPFGEDGNAWAAWVRKTEKRVLSIHAAALRLWSTGGQEAEPWAALTVAKLEAA
jgi:putative RecB family exonuclease